MRNPKHKAKLLFDKANKSSDRKRGIKLLTKAIKLDEQYSDAYALRSICFSMESKHSEAQLDLDKATALSPSSIVTKFAKTTHLFSDKQYKQTIEASTQVINEVIREQILDKQDSSPRIGRFKFTEEDLAYCYSFRALSAVGIQDYNSAIEDFNAIQRLNVSDETKNQALQLKKEVSRKIEAEKEQKQKSRLSYKASQKSKNLIGKISSLRGFIFEHPIFSFFASLLASYFIVCLSIIMYGSFNVLKSTSAGSSSTVVAMPPNIEVGESSDSAIRKLKNYAAQDGGKFSCQTKNGYSCTYITSDNMAVVVYIRTELTGNAKDSVNGTVSKVEWKSACKLSNSSC